MAAWIEHDRPEPGERIAPSVSATEALDVIESEIGSMQHRASGFVTGLARIETVIEGYPGRALALLEPDDPGFGPAVFETALVWWKATSEPQVRREQIPDWIAENVTGATVRYGVPRTAAAFVEGIRQDEEARRCIEYIVSLADEAGDRKGCAHVYAAASTMDCPGRELVGDALEDTITVLEESPAGRREDPAAR